MWENHIKGQKNPAYVGFFYAIWLLSFFSVYFPYRIQLYIYKNKHTNKMKKETIDSNLREFAKIELSADYQDFQDFYQNNKSLLFNNIVQLYKELTKTNESKLKLVVESKLDGDVWSTDFVYSKDDLEMLMNDVLPFYEENEEYEICAEIMKINKKLKKL